MPERAVYDLPLHLVELGRGDEYLALTQGKPGYAWEEAGDAAAGGDLVRASEIYGAIGARFCEAWAALLAAEGTSPGYDFHAAVDYREHLARVLVKRALEGKTG